MKYLSKLLYGTLMGIMGLLLILCLALAAMQAKGFKEMIREKLITSAKEAGITLKIGSIDGTLPFHLTMQDVHLEIDPKDTLDVKKVNMRLAFFPLLKRQISISYLSLIDSKLLYSEEQTVIPQIPYEFPFHMNLRSLKMEDVLVRNYDNGQTGIFSLRARGKLKKYARAFLFDATLTSATGSNSSIRLLLNGDRYTNDNISAVLQVNSKSSTAFKPFLRLPFDIEGSVETFLKGSRSAWNGLLCNAPTSDLLKGGLNANLTRLEIPHLKAFNRKWTIQSTYALPPQGGLDLTKLKIASNLLKLEASGTFDSSFNLAQGNAAFEMPQLALLSLYFPIPLRGSLHGTASLTPDAAFFEINSDQFAIGMQKYQTFSALFKAKKDQAQWKGRAEFLGTNKVLPINGYGDISYVPEKYFILDDLLITAPETRIAGNLRADLPNKQLNGAFFGQVLSLAPFREWAPANSGLDGAIAFNAEFKGQKFSSHFLIKNFHYFRSLADELTLDIEGSDLLDNPRGTLALEGQEISVPHMTLSTFSFNTLWDGAQAPYVLYARGTWKDPLEIQTSGVWKPENLTIDTLGGTVLDQPFTLMQSFSIQKNEESLHISECQIEMGRGNLSFAFDLNKEFSQGYISAKSFPLDLLLISYPNFSLSGQANIDAYIEGNEENLKGMLNLGLEEVDIYQCGKTCPVVAKGFISADLKDNILSVSSDIHAENNQFFTLNATLPITYKLFPFEAAIQKQKALNGTLVFEGRLEEVFDFINIGSNHTAGLLCCNLNLTQTLDDPDLRGEIDLRDGSYENYYTGTQLREVNAHLEAKGNHIELTSFSAKDDHEGKANATGTLDIDINKHFPYAVSAHLDNLKLLRFDMVNANFSGDLAITGDDQAALAKGDLIVSKADLSIPDTLPPDIPTIPITYVNRPANLETYTIAPLSVFPFSLDLNLTAPGPVYLRGRGLRTEWKGNAHLLGTNADIKARGNLLLTKGEFAFSGKVFNITQGEIIMLDQPTQSMHINLKGELQLPDLTVTVVLNGPLKSPALTFQSVPYLPTSSILSYVLFGKDISEITPMQALQVAQTIVTLSGNAGPDVLEKIRKGIGVDRLNIISGESIDDVTVQIGKYLIKGVMVTLSQSYDSTQIIVDVELGHGFILQAETQEVEEGKFSLKWNKNY